MLKKAKKRFNRVLSGVLAVLIAAPNLMQLAASAEEGEKFQYTMFGRNGISMGVSSNLCMNGNLHTNKDTAITATNKNINGKVTTSADIEKRVKHVYADQKIYDTYFTTNCELHEEEYVYSDMNIHINNPLYCYSNITLNGNVSLNSSLGSLMNINVTGEVKNANNSVVYSKYGNITIENDSTANVNGLIYAPLGTVTINSPNVTINGIIIADQVVINGSSVNINCNDNIARFIGETSEEYDFSGLEYLPEEWLGDTDADDLFDIYERVIDSDPLNPDTDGDGLPDGYEVLTLNTDPLEIDTDGNGVLDGNEDFDTDNLVNIDEYHNQTLPLIPDTDEDGFVDGDEVHIYGTIPTNPDTDVDKLLDGEESYDGTIYLEYGVYFDPLNPDTDGDGISDGDEVFGQTKVQEVQTQDEAITEVIVDMETNGNIDRNLTVESMQGIDAMTSNVYALVGEPFNFETESVFESATITFKIDQSKLGDTQFDNLVIMWYNEEKQIFEEMSTTHDASNSTVSTTTTHFSQYMVVDQVEWFDHWNNSIAELNDGLWTDEQWSSETLNTIFLIDCSVEMADVDPITQPVNAWKECKRRTICENIVASMASVDNAAVITFSRFPEFIGSMHSASDSYTLKKEIQEVNNNGTETNVASAIDRALRYIDNDSGEKYRIVILTHSGASFASYAAFGGFDWSNTDMYIVNLGFGEMEDTAERFATHTGGCVYNAVTADQLTSQSGSVTYTPPQFDGTDTDGDTIPDFIELYGLQPNGMPIGTNPELVDSDDDTIPDNIELGYLPFEAVLNGSSEYLSHFTYRTDPSKDDTDGDGLSDGKRILYSGKVMLPIDPNPRVKDGPANVWNKQRELTENGLIATAYTSDRGNSNTVMNEMAQEADMLVDTLLKIKGIATEDVINWVEDKLKDASENGIATQVGADFLDFIYDSKGIAYHSQVETWQKAFGYNDLYDRFFEYGSNMDKMKMYFNYNDDEYVLWSWKGDYWNLQSGAETGLYVYDRTVNGVDHYNVVDFNLPMTLSLFNCTSDGVENIFSWAPDDKQWWVTGFNSSYTEPDPSIMVTINSVNFTGHEEMYKAAKMYFIANQYEGLIFDDDYYTIWTVWE